MAKRPLTNTAVDVLFEQAKSGSVKLTASQRRRVLAYLCDLGEESKFTNIELAKMFQVSDTQVRSDKKLLLAEIGATLTPEMQVTILARHMQELEQLIVRAKRGLDANEPGTLGERFYLETAMKLLRERRETYENTGILQKSLGTLNITEESWVATTDDSGVQGVHRATPEEQVTH